MGLTLGGPALEDSLAIRPRGCRHDRHARPVAAGGGQQRSVHLGHSLGELPGADERDDPAHGG